MRKCFHDFSILSDSELHTRSNDYSCAVEEEFPVSFYHFKVIEIFVRLLEVLGILVPNVCYAII
jgi:hypothetical protein